MCHPVMRHSSRSNSDAKFLNQSFLIIWAKINVYVTSQLDYVLYQISGQDLIWSLTLIAPRLMLCT